MKRTNQTRHIPLSPGKEHTVEVSGSKISTATGPTWWKLEGDFVLVNNIGFVFSGLMQMKGLDPNIRGCRFSWESETLIYHSRNVLGFDTFLI